VADQEQVSVLDVCARRWTLSGEAATLADGRPAIVTYVDGPWVPLGERVEVVEAEPSTDQGAVSHDQLVASLRVEFGDWIEKHPNAGLFDWDVAAANVIRDSAPRGAVSDDVREAACDLGSCWRAGDMKGAGKALARLEDAVGLAEQGDPPTTRRTVERVSRRVNPECNCRSWDECPGSTGPGFQGPCPGPPPPKLMGAAGDA
jgi:hypothetical protein